MSYLPCYNLHCSHAGRQATHSVQMRQSSLAGASSGASLIQVERNRFAPTCVCVSRTSQAEPVCEDDLPVIFVQAKAHSEKVASLMRQGRARSRYSREVRRGSRTPW